MPKILLVEDDENLGFLVQDSLENTGYTVQLCADGATGLKVFKTQIFDLCILDVMLPILDGFSLAKEIRQLNQEVPVFFLTAKARPEDRIHGFNLGADDYLTKPFSIEELTLRVKAILKRTHPATPANKSGQHKITFSECVLDPANQTLLVKGNKQNLTHKETEVLRMLCQNLNCLVKRDEILKTIWEDNGYFVARSMDVFISRLRKYLKADENLKISNIHGIGYKLEENV